MLLERREVVARAGEEVVDGDHFVVLGQEALAQMAAQEARSPRDDGPRQRRPAPSGTPRPRRACLDAPGRAPRAPGTSPSSSGYRTEGRPPGRRSSCPGG